MLGKQTIKNIEPKINNKNLQFNRKTATFFLLFSRSLCWCHSKEAYRLTASDTNVHSLRNKKNSTITAMKN